MTIRHYGVPGAGYGRRCLNDGCNGYSNRTGYCPGCVKTKRLPRHVLADLADERR